MNHFDRYFKIDIPKNSRESNALNYKGKIKLK